MVGMCDGQFYMSTWLGYATQLFHQIDIGVAL